MKDLRDDESGKSWRTLAVEWLGDWPYGFGLSGLASTVNVPDAQRVQIQHPG